MKQRMTEWLVGLIFGIIGGIFLFIGVIFAITTLDFQKTAMQTTGVITDIVRYKDSDGDYSYKAYIKYTVNGSEYNSKLNYYSSSMRIGKELTVYYDNANPTKIQVQGESTFAFIFVGIGGIFFLIGIITLVVRVAKSNDRRRLIKTGEKVYAEIIDVKINYSYRVNGRRPYIITCKWNSLSGEVILKSDNIWFDIDDVIQENNLSTIPVYVDKYNPKKYYVAFEELTKTNVNVIK